MVKKIENRSSNPGWVYWLTAKELSDLVKEFPEYTAIQRAFLSANLGSPGRDKSTIIIPETDEELTTLEDNFMQAGLTIE